MIVLDVVLLRMPAGALLMLSTIWEAADASLFKTFGAGGRLLRASPPPKRYPKELWPLPLQTRRPILLRMLPVYKM